MKQFDPQNITFVYLIARVDGDGVKAPVKIEIASNPIGRLKDLGTACPYPLDLVETFAMSDREYALKAERLFHRLLKKHRLHGEWFDICPHEAFNLIFQEVKSWVIRHGKQPECEAVNILEMITESASKEHYVAEHRREALH